MPVGHPPEVPPTASSGGRGAAGPSRRTVTPAQRRVPPTRGPSYPDQPRQARGGAPVPPGAGRGTGPAGPWSAANGAWDEQPIDQIAMRVPEPASYPATAEVPSYATPPGRSERWDDGGAGAGSYPGPDHPGAFPDDAYGDDSYYDDYEENVGGDDDLPKRRGCRSALIVLTVFVVIAAALGWYSWSWVQERIDPPGPQGDEVLVEVPEGTSTAGVGDILADAGIISDATVWDWYTKLRDVGTIQAGSYLMRVDSSFTEAIDALAAEPLPPDSRLVTVPEGLTQAQIAARLVDPEDGVPGFTIQGMRAALADPASRSPLIPAEQTLLEGVLFPETYTVEEGDTELIVVRRMVDQFQEVATEVDLEARAAALGRTPYEVLIVASMIEREAGIPEDGPRVARVVYNRLDQEIPLGIDATSCYELGGTPCDLTTGILNDNTPYDTRAQQGLPPTPIASPGQAAIEAALSPADGDWIYYILDVTKDDGSSLFTSSAAEFEDAKERCVAAGRCG
jgi:UPF0755 protein